MKIIIMGATSGIGLELARLYHNAGHKVAIAARRIEILKEISKELSDCPYEQIDIVKDNSTSNFNKLIELLGGMDLYIHVSGIGMQNRSLDTDIELSTVETNVTGFTRMINYVYHYFSNQGFGHIAVVTSIAGTKGIGVAPSYSASKRYNSIYLQALEQLSHIKGYKIIFTDIRPGFVDTEMLSKDFNYPMMMSSQKVAGLILKGIAKRKRVITIDWRYRILVMLWRLIPSCIWVKLKIG